MSRFALLLAVLVLVPAVLVVAPPAGAAKTPPVTVKQAKTFARDITNRTMRELLYDRARIRCWRRSVNDVRCRLRYWDKGRPVCSVVDKFWNSRGYTRSRYVEGSARGNKRC